MIGCDNTFLRAGIGQAGALGPPRPLTEQQLFLGRTNATKSGVVGGPDFDDLSLFIKQAFVYIFAIDGFMSLKLTELPSSAIAPAIASLRASMEKIPLVIDSADRDIAVRARFIADAQEEEARLEDYLERASKRLFDLTRPFFGPGEELDVTKLPEPPRQEVLLLSEWGKDAGLARLAITARLKGEVQAHNALVDKRNAFTDTLGERLVAYMAFIKENQAAFDRDLWDQLSMATPLVLRFVGEAAVETWRQIFVAGRKVGKAAIEEGLKLLKKVVQGPLAAFAIGGALLLLVLVLAGRR